MKKITEITQSPLFAKQKKKLHKNQIRDLDQAIQTIVKEPEAGHLKTGNLCGIRVYKFQSIQEQVLLAYEVVENHLYLYAFGTHENFYRQLKKYINR
ncbi:MAG: type II toxin-antitoxin system RelE/ParE family toxin [Pseudomonadota bacterium]|uniref:Type II toxin-antitoxin system RelE/ParE family toxin n=1 Tax=Candidatus Desulfatibia profunda TaxID=2841695 RepID=A0A8J6NU79_9BACT|nr:type II toxin-antitoxin system RelE/ParE family toxin [Candidatus Desulfatibia profunda]